MKSCCFLKFVSIVSFIEDAKIPILNLKLFNNKNLLKLPFTKMENEDTAVVQFFY